tara:strand:- start:590 stop:1267 length:678 start_codon:yes stop_codon:yes gene_type:complete
MINIDNLLIVAPHIDDETLGCGGTILKLKKKNKKISMILVSEANGYTEDKKILKKKERQVQQVKKFYRFDNFIRFDYPSSQIYKIDEKELINKFDRAIKKIKPDTIIMPFVNDVHSDHRIISKVLQSCIKIFRKKYIKTVLFCEIISETDHSILSCINGNFNPNLFINITSEFKKKIEIFKNFTTENGKHPFPRSVDSLTSLSKYRGSQCGHTYAEGFMISRIIS